MAFVLHNFTPNSESTNNPLLPSAGISLTVDTQLTSENAKAREILSRMTLKEKFQTLTSPGIRRIYSTKPIKRLGIPSFRMTDGPLGVAYHSSGFTKCTRFPATISVAAGWNRELAREMGVAMAEEIRSVNRHMLLAPGVNIARTPVNGRTFEYFSEDPYLTKELAIPLVQGVQSLGVGACIKHYAANNQEIDRRSNNSVVDERTLHEIYLRAFEEIVREADPWSVMGCYNKVNGVYGCENEYLIRDTLMGKWGFKGFVMSDWFATRPIETTEGCINGGLSLEMPFSSKYKKKTLLKAFEEGKFTKETLDELVYRFLRVMFLTGAFEERSKLPQGSRNTTEHQALAQRIAEEGMVLLKNKGDLLPLNLEDLGTVSLTGANLKKKFGRVLSGGSSAVVAPHEITPLKTMQEKLKGKVEIVSDASKADVAFIFAGLNHSKGMDSESYDRPDLQLPEEQIELINATAKDNPNTIVVLIAGSPIAMDQWIENVPVVLDAWFPGMEGGRAIANILFGDASPSGKLPITFPQKLADSPAHHSGLARNYPGDEVKDVHYDEGIFVGYRWFDEKEIAPLFPFGFGLGYTSFDFEDAHLISQTSDTLTVNVDIENTGESSGAEVIQVYSHDLQSSVERPPKELAGFEKVMLAPGERKTIPVDIRTRDLMFYDVDKHDWRLEPGEFELQIGSSSRNIHTKIMIEL